MNKLVTHATRLGPLISNAEANLLEIHHDGFTLPVIVPQFQGAAVESATRCWTTCMESAVVGYPIDEWRKHAKPNRLEMAVARIIGMISSCGPWRRAVQPGSLPFSTTVRGKEVERMLWKLLPVLRQEMPDRPFVVRHVFPESAPDFPADAVLLPARVIYVQDFSKGNPASSILRRDLKTLGKSPLIHVADHEFDKTRVDEALGLYQQLYIGRYSRRHPRHSAALIDLARERSWIKLEGLADPRSNRLLGFHAWHEADGMLTVPFLGHDLSMPKEARLYRHLFAMSARHALERKLVENASSGAGEFKRNRGYRPVLEYLLVMPALRGTRRASDRAVLALAHRTLGRMTLEDFLKRGG